MIAIDGANCKGCGICVRFCPKHALEISKQINARGYYAPLVVDASVCSGCRQCELLCPDFAIFHVEEDNRGDG